MEIATQYIKLAIRLLGGSHPTRLSGGVIFGVVLYFGADFASRVYPENNFLKQASETNTMFFIGIGLILFFARVWLGRTSLSEENAAFIEILRIAMDKGDFTKLERRQYWRMFLDKALSSFNPAQNTSAKSEEVLRSIRLDNQPPDGSN